MASLSGVLLFVFGCFIGLSFPDLDNRFYWYPVLVHRSILTHSPLLPLLIYFAVRHALSPPACLFVIGVSLATAVHLGFDVYPRDWTGYALLNVPFYGRASSAFSEGWFLVSMAVCLALGCWLIRSMGEFLLAFFGLIVTYGVCAAREPWASFYVLVWLLPVAFLAFVLSRPSNEPDDPGARLRELVKRR